MVNNSHAMLECVILHTLNSIPRAVTLGEIKSSVAQYFKNQPGEEVKRTVETLVADGKILHSDCKYMSRRHMPKFRTLDADWQW